MIRTATAHDAPLLAALHDQARAAWSTFSSESPEGIVTGIAEDGLIYLVLDERAAVCLYTDISNRFCYMDFPYATPGDADLLIRAALDTHAHLRIECQLPVEQNWQADLLRQYDFQVTRSQRRMVHAALETVQVPQLPSGLEATTVTPNEVEALHDIIFPGFHLPASWRADPMYAAPIGLRRDGQLVGYGLTSCQGGVHWISEVGVHPAYRRQGLGRHLTLLALAQRRAAGATEVHLHVSDPHDQEAPRLYERLGFVTRHWLVRFVRDSLTD